MIKSAIQQKNISSILKERRIARNLSVEQIAELTKIRAEYLYALEDGDFGKFPSEVYLKGFLKNYAKFLGVSSHEAVALYRRENIVTPEKKQNEFFKKIKESGRNFVITPNKIIAASIGVIIIIILFYLSSYFGTILKRPAITLTSPIRISQDGEYSINVEGDSVHLTGTLETNAIFSINGQDISPATVTSFDKTIQLTGGISSQNKFVIKAVTPFGRDSTITLNVTQIESSSSVMPSITQAQKINASLEILINNTNLSVFVDGALMINKVYPKSTVLQFTAESEIMITTDKDSAVNITINGVQEKMTGKNVTYEVSNGKIIKI